MEITGCAILRVITEIVITGIVITEIVIRRLFPFLSHYILNRSYSFVLMNIFVQSIPYSIFRFVSFISSYSLFLASVSITGITISPVIIYLLLFFTLSHRCCLLFLNFPFLYLLMFVNVGIFKISIPFREVDRSSIFFVKDKIICSFIVCYLNICCLFFVYC